ncbi:MAG TPA: fructose-bisphosphate aldolase, partial [Chromatiales bacterium]|nr:fructose-bisphosphate aldolase [Chromatiales bacterium]
NGVMLDASRLPLPDNIEMTRKVVDMAHGCGVPVMGEVGYVAGREGEEARFRPGDPVLTVPAEARAYVERTGVDCLAVSIGTIQGRFKGRAKLDFQRLKQLRERLSIPLEIHGGSGLNEEQFRKLAALGIAKINYYTALSDVAADVMRKQSKSNRAGSFIDLKKGVKEAVGEEVRRCLRIWGSAGRAAEVLAQCRDWSPVEQFLLFDLHDTVDGDIDSLQRQIKHVFENHPGVRSISFGEAVIGNDHFDSCCKLQLVSEACLIELASHPDFSRLAKASRGESLFKILAQTDCKGPWRAP